MTTRADKEYGGALYALAREEGLEDSILADCGLISAMLRENPDYVKLMSAPGIPTERKIALIEKAFAESVTPYTMNFLSLLVSRGRFYCCAGSLDEFRRLYDGEHDIVTAYAASAEPITPEQEKALVKSLEKRTGKRIRLEKRTDPSLIGGMTVKCGERLYDGSVRGRIESIKNAITSREGVDK